MAPKNKRKGSGRRSKTPGQTSASNPNPTATSPSVSSPTGDATTTSILSSSASQIITTQPLPSPPSLPVQETQQEFISSTSSGSTTTTPGLAGTSTSTSASTLCSMKHDFTTNIFAPVLACAMTALQKGMEDDPADQVVVAALFGLQPEEMESTLQSLRLFLEIMKGKPELKETFKDMLKMEGVRSAIKLTEVLLAERKKRHGSGGSCGGSKGGGGSPDGGSGEGDGEGGGVSA